MITLYVYIYICNSINKITLLDSISLSLYNIIKNKQKIYSITIMQKKPKITPYSTILKIKFNK